MPLESTHSNLPIEEDSLTLEELRKTLTHHWKFIALSGLVCAGLGAAIAFLLPPIYTARTVILPPQQQNSMTASALGSLSALAGLGGSAVKNPTDQYISFMLSTTVEDRIISQFKLMELYNEKYLSETRKKLEENVNITAGKKDGLITVEVDDKDPQRASAMANAFVDGLRFMTNRLAVTEAQQRRLFFEGKLKEAQQNLAQAQLSLQGTGYNPDALKTEPSATAESYARLRAEVTVSESKLQSLLHTMAPGAPEVIQARAALGTLQAEMLRMEKSNSPKSGEEADYISQLREFKYQETLFELFSKQYEIARVDESREGAFVQVVDEAAAPDRKSKPKRGLIISGAMLAGILLSSLRKIIQFRRSD